MVPAIRCADVKPSSDGLFRMPNKAKQIKLLVYRPGTFWKSRREGGILFYFFVHKGHFHMKKKYLDGTVSSISMIALIS